MFSSQHCWAHSTLSSTSLKINPGPTQAHQPIVRKAALGPFNIIGSLSSEQEWANLTPSAASLKIMDGPIPRHWQILF
jgi:hypothetical protein